MNQRVPLPMLRGFVRSPSLYVLFYELARFAIQEENLADVTILRFEIISPDSFMWRLNIDTHIYYLYAEDHVQGLTQVNDIFVGYLESEQFELVEVRRQLAAEDTDPLHYGEYRSLKDADEMMRYASTSGFDFVFLCKSGEDTSGALFSAETPRGFSERHKSKPHGLNENRTSC